MTLRFEFGTCSEIVTKVDKKKCYSCGEVKLSSEFYSSSANKDRLSSRCRVCHNIKSREWQRNNPARIKELTKQWRALNADRYRRHNVEARLRHRERFPERDRARQSLTREVTAGRIIPKPCEVCQSTKRIEAHHDDYSKRLEVRWFCRKHHLAHDKVLKLERQSAAQRVA